MHRPASLLSVLFLSIVSLAHLARVIYNVEFVVAGISIPVWMSSAAFVFCGFLAIWLFKERASV
jgi:hypothetical protein